MTCIALVFLTAPAYAHNGVNHATEAEARAHMNAEVSVPMKPLDVIKARAQQIKQDTMNARVELKADTRMEMKNASTSREKKDVMRNFMDDRKDIAQQRFASSSELRRNVKAAIRWHGGLIRERFVVALRQLEKIVARIESRIKKLEAEGVAVASVEAELELAKAAIVTAQADAQAVADFVASVNDTTDRAAIKAELEAKIRTAHASLKAAHQALMKTVRVLVALKPRAGASASVETSVETTIE